jgi:hypothetical protein
MSMDIVFNTGRLYTDKGQRIAARVVRHTDEGDAVIAMVDIDRHIEGTYTTMCVDKPTSKDILNAYDFDMRAKEGVAYDSPVWEELRAAARAL